MRVFASLVLCALMGMAAAAPPGGQAEAAYTEVDRALPKPPGEGADVERVVDASIAGTNALRQRHALPALHRERHLMEAARGFAGFLSETHRVGHTADGRTPAERAEAAGYRYCSVRENLAYRYSSLDFAAEELAGAFVEGWKNSPEHRENLLSEHSVDTAVAVARSAETGAYFAVQMFGQPASARIRFEVVNEAGRSVRYTVGEGGASGRRQELELPPNAVHEHERCGPVTVGVPAAGGETPVEVQDEAVLRLTAGRDGPVAVDVIERAGGRDGR